MIGKKDFAKKVRSGKTSSCVAIAICTAINIPRHVLLLTLTTIFLPFLHFDQTLVRMRIFYVSFPNLKNLELEFMFIQRVFNMQFQN